MQGARGEGFIQSDDKEIRVLFTNRALAEAENALGKSVLAVLQGFVDGGSGITDLAHLLRAGMQAARRDARERGRVATLNDAYDVMDEVGFASVATTVMESVAAVIGYSANGDDQDNDEESDPNG